MRIIYNKERGFVFGIIWITLVCSLLAFSLVGCKTNQERATGILPKGAEIKSIRNTRQPSNFWIVMEFEGHTYLVYVRGNVVKTVTRMD